MIPFFRKIRKKMADDNKPLQYMRYAIGEIFLVVIGILIALQINNWNETRKERIKERILLLGLKEDLARNKELIEEDIKRHKHILNSIETLLHAYSEELVYNDTLNGYFHMARVYPKGQLSFVAFNEIKSKGTDIITSGDLRKKIVNLFEITFTDLIETTNRLESPLRSIQLEHQTKNFFVESGVLIPNDPEKLIRESEYFNILSQRRQYYNYFLLMKENSLKELEIVQDLIEQELSM